MHWFDYIYLEIFFIILISVIWGFSYNAAKQRERLIFQNALIAAHMGHTIEIAAQTLSVLARIRTKLEGI